MIRYLPVHVASWLLIVVFCCEVYSQGKAEKCNVKMWYLDLVTEGALSRDLSDQQLILKGKIEKMVDKYKKLGRADGMVDCSILQMYEELLGEEPTGGRETQVSDDGKFNDDITNKEVASSPDGASGKDDESDKVSGKNDNVKDDKQNESDDMKDDEEKKSHVKDDAQDESDDVNEDEYKESDDVKEGEQKESEYKKNDKDNKSDDGVDDKAESNDKGNALNDITKDDDEGTHNGDGNGGEGDGDKTGDDFVDDTDLDDTDFGDDDEAEEDDVNDDKAEAQSLEEASEDKASESSDKASESSDKASESSDEASESLDRASESSDKASESSDKASEISDNGSESSDKNNSEKSLNKGTGSSDEKVSGSSKIKDSESPAKDSSDDKDLSEGEQSSESADDKDSKSVTKESDSAGEDRKLDAEDTQVRKRKTKLVEETVFDPKRGYVKVVKEVEVDDDEEGEEEEEVGDKEGKDIKGETEKQNEKLEKDYEKTKIEKEEGENDGYAEDNDKEKQRQKEIEEERQREKREEDKRREEEKERARKEKEDEEKRKEKEMELAKEEEEKKKKEKANKQEDDEGEKRNKKPWENTKGKEKKPWEKAKNREESYDGSCSGDSCEEQNSNDSEIEDSVYKYTGQAKHNKGSEDEEPQWRKSQKRNNEAEDSEKEAGRVDFRDFTADLHRFEMLFQQRASEYASKIQNLEIMIIRLENQLLGERLNKQNSTSSFSKLENQILRLENELLKLNQSYADLKEENVMLKYRQRKYLELGTDKSKDQSSMGNSTKHFELINKQQNRISELSALLMNHSALFDKLQSKSHALEEQNQALYQIVMNQTALISNIMKKMQELSEENMKHRKETQDLKTQMEFKTNSDRLLEKLNTFVSVQIPSADSSGQREERQKSGSRVFRMHNLFPKSPGADVRPWRCNGNNSSRFCVFYSFILSPCPPFSTVYWHKCPYYYKDIAQEDEIHKESSQTSKPRSSHTQVSSEESKTGDSFPSTTSTKSFVNVDDGASKEASPSISSEDGKVLEEILKQERDSQHEEGKTKGDTSEEKSEKIEVKSETLASKSEEPPSGSSNEKEPKASKDSEDKARLPTVEEVKVAPPKPAEPRHEDRKILYTTDKKLPKPRDCYEYMENGYERNGMYKIYVVGQEKHLPVYCDMNGGWTVIMKRSSGALDFYRNWNEYKKGFGGFYSEHWLGNDNLHYLTNQKQYSLKVVLEDFSFNSTFAVYDHFWIDDEDEDYRLHISGYSGTAGDGFAKHNKMKFSTKDADNDLITKELEEHDHSCAKRFTGAWWYYKCYMSNLTGQYYKNGHVPNKKFNGVSWKPWKKPHISLKGAIMMIRPFKAD